MTVTIADVSSSKGLVGGPFGSSLTTADYSESGVPVIRGGNMDHGLFIGGNFAFVSDEKFVKDLSRNSARPGDLVYTQRGTLGQVAMVPTGEAEVYVVSQSQMRLRVDEGRFDAKFVYYASKSTEFARQISDSAISTGVPHINLGILARLEIPDLPLTEQRAIAEVLGALDDKIAANATLVAAAEALLSASISRLLDDGSDSVPLSSLAAFVNGRPFTKGANGTGRVVIRIAELNSGIGGSTVYNDIDVPDDHLARPGDLLFAWSGSLTARRWFREEGIINQHIFKVIPTDGHPMWLVHDAVNRKLADFKAIAADKATTMGHIQRRHLDQVVAIPSGTSIAQHDAALSALWSRALAAEVESLALSRIRDELLPLLMSGKVRVKDAEKIVEELI